MSTPPGGQRYREPFTRNRIHVDKSLDALHSGSREGSNATGAMIPTSGSAARRSQENVHGSSPDRGRSTVSRRLSHGDPPAPVPVSRRHVAMSLDALSPARVAHTGATGMSDASRRRVAAAASPAKQQPHAPQPPMYPHHRIPPSAAAASLPSLDAASTFSPAAAAIVEPRLRRLRNPSATAAAASGNGSATPPPQAAAALVTEVDADLMYHLASSGRGNGDDDGPRPPDGARPVRAIVRGGVEEQLRAAVAEHVRLMEARARAPSAGNAGGNRAFSASPNAAHAASIDDVDRSPPPPARRGSNLTQFAGPFTSDMAGGMIAGAPAPTTHLRGNPTYIAGSTQPPRSRSRTRTGSVGSMDGGSGSSLSELAPGRSPAAATAAAQRGSDGSLSSFGMGVASGIVLGPRPPPNSGRTSTTIPAIGSHGHLAGTQRPRRSSISLSETIPENPPPGIRREGSPILPMSLDDSRPASPKQHIILSGVLPSDLDTVISASQVTVTVSTPDSTGAAAGTAAASLSPLGPDGVPAAAGAPPPTPDADDDATPRPDPTDMYEPLMYPPTHHQQFLYMQLAGGNGVFAGGDQYNVHIASYKVVGTLKVHAGLLARCVSRAARVHRILYSRLGRNPRIVDADIEAHITVPPMPSTLDSPDPQVRVAHSGLDPEDVAVLVAQAAKSLHKPLVGAGRSLSNPMLLSNDDAAGNPVRGSDLIGANFVGWCAYVHVHPPTDTTRIYIAMSPLVGDARSCDVLAGAAWQGYHRALALGFGTTTSANIPAGAMQDLSTKKQYAIEERLNEALWRPRADYVDHAEDEGTEPARHREQAVVACKAAVFESRQEYVEKARRAHLEREMARVASERAAADSQVAALLARVGATEMLLGETEAVCARLAEAASGAAAGKVMAVVRDPTAAGEVLEVTTEVHESLLRDLSAGNAPVISGLDHGTEPPSSTAARNAASPALPTGVSPTMPTLTADQQLIAGILERHGVSLMASSRLAAALTLYQFAEVTETELHNVYSVVGRDKRRASAVADHIRNRIRTALTEHAKRRYDLERRTLRLRRDAKDLRSQLETKQGYVDKLSHSLLQYKNLVHPPLSYSLIPAVALDARVRGDGRTPYASLTDLFPGHGNDGNGGGLGIGAHHLPLGHMFVPRQSLLTQLSRYAREFCKLKADEDDDDKLHHVFMAMYAVLVKHIAGIDSFVIGYRVSLRRSPRVAAKAGLSGGVAIGPGLSVTVPVRVDMRERRPLYEYVARVSRDLRAAERRAMHLGSDDAVYAAIDRDIEDKLAARELDVDPGQSPESMVPYRPMVIFEYISQAEVKLLDKHGVPAHILVQADDPADLTQDGKEPGPTPTNPRFALTKEWGTSPVHPVPDLHLTVVEVGTDHVAARLAFRRDVAPRVAARWVDKYVSLLEGCDVNVRQVTVATLISRFYHSVWSAGIGGMPTPDGAPPGPPGPPPTRVRKGISNSDGSIGEDDRYYEDDDVAVGSVAELRQSIADLI
ncbi:hypothetical protein BC828DRAFT_417518 [Blastocladiella britannica]|nr:hypothetical protein BC828DRAFT_417518 [Blastocladiella britannica]